MHWGKLHSKPLIALGIILIIVCSAKAFRAFSQGGSIRGRVVADIPDQRRILSGVVVTLSGERLGDRKIQSITDTEGQFDFQGLVAGEYLLTVEFEGFKKYEQRLSVQIDATVEHDVLLQPVPLTESVTVTEDRTGRNIFLSYVRSKARGNLNDFNTYFGNLKHAVIRPDEYETQPFDAPHRLLFWGDFGLPFDVVATPVVDWRSGFPFSLVNEEQEFVGPRNEGGRFPKLMSFDLLVMKGLTIPFRGKKNKGRAGFTIFNITNHWNPRDVQNNLESRQFGTFFNSPDRSVRLKFEFVKY